MANIQDKKFPVKRNATMGGVVLVDPDSGKPYKAGVTVQQVEGGFDPTGLSTEEKQNAIISALEDLISAITADAAGPTEVAITDDQLPPVEGQATASKQDLILGSLANLAALLGGTIKVTSEGTMAVSLASQPLPTGAATAAKQDDLLAAITALEEATGTEGLASQGTLESILTRLLGTLSVNVTNSSVPVTIGNTVLPVELEEPLSVTAAQPIPVSGSVGVTGVVPISDNGGSVTVDGAVSVSGPVQIEDNGGSITVDGSVAATQAGSWSVGITGTPTVNVGNTVTISDGSGPLTVDGTVALSNASLPVTQSGAWNFTMNPTATSAALTPFRNTALTSAAVQVKASAGRIYQYSFYNSTNAAVYVHFYNALPANVTAGTTVPLVTLGVPPGSSLDGAWSASPAAFTTAISVSASTAVAGTGNPTAGILCQLGYV